MELHLLAWQVEPSILSFIFALRKLGNVRSVYCDNGSNCIGAERELEKAYSEINEGKIQSFMEGIGGDWVKWQKNLSFASHMGGVWERQIHSARAILPSMIKTHGKSLENESLLTLMNEVEEILNSQPLTVEMINNLTSIQQLVPAKILTIKSMVLMPPLGKFLRPDLHCRRR